MLGSIQVLRDHADEVAARCASYDPEPGDRTPRRGMTASTAPPWPSRSERQLVDAITAARAKDVSWTADRRARRHLSPGSTAALRQRHPTS